MLVDFSAGAADLLIDRSAVTAARALSVQEVIARHRQQQTQAGCARCATTARTSGWSSTSVRASPIPATTSSPRTTYFVEGNGGRMGRAELLGERIEVGRRPSRVSAAAGREGAVAAARAAPEPGLPLRAGRASSASASIDCYRVRFEPTTRRRGALSRARSGSIASRLPRCACKRCKRARRRRLSRTRRSTPTKWWRTSTARRFIVLTRQTARQIVLIAGRNLLLEKAAQVQRLPHQRRRLSPLRARRRGRASASCIAIPIRACAISSSRATARVVSDRSTTRAKAMAIGVLVDPSFAFPLPIFGINYLDFEVARPQRHAVCAAVWRRARRRRTCSGRKSPARRSTRALIFSASPCRRAIALYCADGEQPERAAPDVAALSRRESRLAIHGVSEGRVSISAALRSVRSRSDDG